MANYWEEQQLKQSGYFEEAPKPTDPDPMAGKGALETTLENVKKTLWDIERHTSDTQSRLDVNNKSGPTFYNKQISRWAADPWGLDIMNETLPEIRDAVEELGQSKDNFLTRGIESIKEILANSAIARKSDSPLETSLASFKDSTVSFNEKTLRWHDDQTNLMVKGDDPRVAEAMKPEPSALETAVGDSTEMVTEKKVGLGVLAGFLEEIKTSNQLILETLGGGEDLSAEEIIERAKKAAKAAKEEKKQTSFLGNMWESMKEKGKKSWFAENWKMIAGGLIFLFAPLKWIKKLWTFLKDDFWPFFKEHPILTTLGLIATWFIGGAFLSSLGVALGTAVAGLFTGGGAAAAGMGLIGKLFLGVKAAALGGLASPLAIVGALAMAIFDGFTGLAMSGDWKVSKISGFLGGFFAGNKGWMGMFANMGKWAVAGAALGFPFGGIGAIPGGLVGAALGAIFNLIGGKRVAQAFNNLGGIFMKLWTPIWDALKMLWTDFRTYLIDPIANWLGNVWTSMTDDWSKNWGKFKSDLKETWDSIISPFKMLWDFLMDPANVITGEGIMEAVGAVGAKLKEWVSSLIGMVPFGDYILPNSLLEWAGLKAAETAETPTDDTDTTQPATETVAKTKDEKARVAGNLATLDELQEEGGVLGMRDKGVDSKTQEAIEGIGTDDLRMALFGAKHVGLDKKDPALVKAMAEELKKRSMAKDDTEATIMTKGEWTASDEYKETFKGEGASSGVQQMEYEKYVETMRGPEAKARVKKETEIKKIVENYRTKRASTKSKGAKKLQDKRLQTKMRKMIASGDTEGVEILQSQLKGAEVGRFRSTARMVKGEDGKLSLEGAKDSAMAKAFSSGDVAEEYRGPGYKTESSGVFSEASARSSQEAANAFAAQLSGGADQRMNTFNDITKKNQTLQEEKSGSPTVVSTIEVGPSSNVNNQGDAIIIPSIVSAPRLTTSLAKD